MTDQELDRLMRHVLMDGVEQKSEQPSEADNGEAPAFQPSPRYQRQITAMKRDPWAWSRKKQRPAWKKCAQTAAALLLAAGLGLAASPTARADIVRLAVEWNQNRASFVYSGPDVGRAALLRAGRPARGLCPDRLAAPGSRLGGGGL
ncbi:MAG: hypothetical protein V8S34_08975 [Lawsonibacter sp.]